MNHTNSAGMAEAPGSTFCASCGSHNLSSTKETDTVECGSAGNKVALPVEVRVWHCADCGFAFTKEDATTARHNAICSHLGILNPEEIKEIREKYALSQAEYAEVLGFGKASLSRWEGGLLIQNQSSDNLLFLSTFKENLSRLKYRYQSLEGTVSPVRSNNFFPFAPQFRAIKPEDQPQLQVKQKQFQLYLHSNQAH